MKYIEVTVWYYGEEIGTIERQVVARCKEELDDVMLEMAHDLLHEELSEEEWEELDDTAIEVEMREVTPYWKY